MFLSPSSRAQLRIGVCAASLCICLPASPLAAAQQQQPAGGDAAPVAAAPATDDGEIVVRAERLKGQLDVDVPPLLELDQQDIAAEGVTSIADLVTQISVRTGSARGRGGGGRPIILINGIRVGSFREFFQYPPEALERVEVFPEEVAQRFGFSPDRRVVNLILKENFASREVELEFEGPSRGGYFVNNQELGYLQIKDGGRLNFNFEANDTGLLTESERDIVQTPGSISDVAGDPDQAEFRSLINDSRSLEASVSWAKAFLDSGASVSTNLTYDRNDNRGLSGLNLVTLTDPSGDSALRTFGEQTPLERRTSTDTIASSGSLSKSVNSFRLTTTFDASLSETETEIDRRFDTSGLEADAAAGLLAIDAALPTNVDAGFDIASNRNLAAQSQTTVRGPLANLPGGELIATFDFGGHWTRIESADTRTLRDTELTRRRLSAGANLIIPITSRRNGFADALGSFTLTANAGFDELSDFGLLGDYNIALIWKPTDRLNITANYIVREVAPSLAALGNPQITTLNATVFDFVTGETVLAAVTTGGNPDLLAETQRDWKFSANWELPFIDNTRFSVEYIRNRSQDVTSGFPVLTSEIEAAFPGRVTRDAGGTLIAVDSRSVTFAETKADRLQFNLFTRGSFGVPEPSEGDRRSAGRGGPPRGSGPPPGSGRARGNRGPRGGAGGPPDEGRRAQFLQFRERLCADDGLEFITRLIERVEAGDNVSDDIPGFDPERFERILSRVRGEDGKIAPEAIEQLRERICSRGAGAGGGAGGGPGGGSGNRQAGARSGGGPLGGGNPFARGRRPGWRYFISLNHTIELENEILIAPGIAPLDQLDGDATSAFGFPRNNTRLEAGLFGGGIGFRLSGRYTGKTRLDGSGLPGSTDLFFGDLLHFDLRAFTNLGELLGEDEGVLKNLRVSLRADNILDARRTVTDESGETPINYQPFLIDPTGRYLGIDIRKLF